MKLESGFNFHGGGFGLASTVSTRSFVEWRIAKPVSHGTTANASRRVPFLVVQCDAARRIGESQSWFERLRRPRIAACQFEDWVPRGTQVSNAKLQSIVIQQVRWIEIAELRAEGFT